MKTLNFVFFYSYKDVPSKSENRHEPVRVNEKEMQPNFDRDFPEEQTIVKPLKRPDSKESLSSHSDRSSQKTDKLSSVPTRPVVNNTAVQKWPAEDKQKSIQEPTILPVEEEEDGKIFKRFIKVTERKITVCNVMMRKFNRVQK